MMGTAARVRSWCGGKAVTRCRRGRNARAICCCQVGVVAAANTGKYCNWNVKRMNLRDTHNTEKRLSNNKRLNAKARGGKGAKEDNNLGNCGSIFASEKQLGGEFHYRTK